MQFNKHLLRSFTHQASNFKASVSDHVLFLWYSNIFLSFSNPKQETGVCKVVDLSVAVTCSWKSTDGSPHKKEKFRVLVFQLKA